MSVFLEFLLARLHFGLLYFVSDHVSVLLWSLLLLWLVFTLARYGASIPFSLWVSRGAGNEINHYLFIEI